MKPTRSKILILLALPLSGSPLPAQDYSSAVLADSPLAYYPLGTPVPANPGRVAAVNLGTLGATANGQHFPGAGHLVPGALAAGGDTATFFNALDKVSGDGNYSTLVPYTDLLHGESFTWEGWVRPTAQGRSNAQCVVKNHTPSGNRVGWVLWQRAANGQTPGGDGSGWNLRLYKAESNALLINITTGNSNPAGTYTVGQWQHLAFTYNQGDKTAIFYVNGVEVARQTAATGSYVRPTAGTTDMTIGGFPDSRQNPFEGDIDEVALYTTVLNSGTIEDHYENGIDPTPSQNYPDLIAMNGPVAYYRMNEAPLGVVANLGTAGAAANGVLVNAPAPVDGPKPPAYTGFAADNKASNFTGALTYVELNGPAALNFTGAMTLEAWVKPGNLLPGDLLNPSTYSILAHGGNQDFQKEVFLRVENHNYEVGTGAGKVSVPMPAGDINSNHWIHLVGTWSAGTWTLYRNGSVLGSAADPSGPMVITDANWAIGARGRWDSDGNFPAGNIAAHRVFLGGISNAAIYNSALSADRVKTHLFTGIGAAPLTVTRTGGTTTLTWSAGILQQSDDLEDWADVPGATSPRVVADGPSHFYRLRY